MDGEKVWTVDVFALAGDGVTLGCRVSSGKCGAVHNIKWYKNGERVFVYSELADIQIQRAEGDLVGRSQLFPSPDGGVFELVISPVRPEDQGLYKCDITYLEVDDQCAVVQFVNLTTLAKPDYVKITMENGTEVENSSMIGPYNEGSELTLLCESGGGKPIPRITWWNGTQSVPGTKTVQFLNAVAMVIPQKERGKGAEK
ncbi:unnamed protein product [Darwinula stevensoni]|uniref:Ig-like domain-containing protein n=1 Tax=Darwinula stevensoni TaxID=69355 RepID=A0A7R8X6H2_9CRUS|nr:unnamed protein product [Darwinula stevensoni]CAG0881270.1 unnamed protein product [Darwinula stevensoni]